MAAYVATRPLAILFQRTLATISEVFLASRSEAIDGCNGAMDGAVDWSAQLLIPTAANVTDIARMIGRVLRQLRDGLARGSWLTRVAGFARALGKLISPPLIRFGRRGLPTLAVNRGLVYVIRPASSPPVVTSP
jgi:hypothetical protein